MLLVIKEFEQSVLVKYKVGWGLFVPSNKQYKQSQLPVIGTLFVIIVNFSLCNIFISENIGIDILYKCKC